MLHTPVCTSCRLDNLHSIHSQLPLATLQLHTFKLEAFFLMRIVSNESTYTNDGVLNISVYTKCRKHSYS